MTHRELATAGLDLLPCPFCGGAPAHCPVGQPSPGYWVTCFHCGCQSTDVGSRKNAARRWNTRAPVNQSPHHEAALRALEAVMAWIDNWSPNFTEDDEWPETEQAARAVLTSARSEK